jgi:hypothetical protein
MLHFVFISLFWVSTHGFSKSGGRTSHLSLQMSAGSKKKVLFHRACLPLLALEPFIHHAYLFLTTLTLTIEDCDHWDRRHHTCWK